MLLINSSPKDALKIFQPFLPIFVPVGPGYLVAACRKNNINVELIDEQVEDNVLNKIKAYTQRTERPYIFGFSVLTAAVKSALLLSKQIKTMYPDSVIVFGGVHPTAMPDEMLSYDQVDIVVRGEGEKIIPKLYHSIKKGENLQGMQGVSYKNGKNIVHNPMGQIITDLDSIPLFPYDLFANNERYDMGFVVSSRGCPYKCIFCSNRVTTSSAYRYRSNESIVGELEKLNSEYKKNFVLFLDDNFLVNKERIYSLTKNIRDKGLHNKMTFSFQARGDNVDKELLEDLYRSGFKSIFFGIETASDELLKIVKKGETLEEIIDAVNLSKKIGFHVSATFMYGLPTENHQDRMKSLRLSKALDLDMVRFNNATPYPGTELYTIANNEKRLKIIGSYENFNSVSTFIESPFKKIPFSYVPEGNTEAQIRNDILFSYLAFYMDINKVKKIFANPSQGVGWFNAGRKLMELIKKVPSIAMLSIYMAIKYTELLFNVLLSRDSLITWREATEIIKTRENKGR
ncbi:MAG: radical SAM protein [Pseudomonadota bacterium]